MMENMTFQTFLRKFLSSDGDYRRESALFTAVDVPAKGQRDKKYRL